MPAQLRHVLAAGQSARVPEEYEHGAVAVLQRILERNDAAINSGKTE
ncbi:MAG: hypothetical protein V1912_10330 [bacterium]